MLWRVIGTFPLRSDLQGCIICTYVCSIFLILITIMADIFLFLGHWRCGMAWCQGVPQFSIRGAAHWGIDSNKSQSASTGWQLWCLGWYELFWKLRERNAKWARSGLFSTFDCAVKGIRKKEDPYNASTVSQSPMARLEDLRSRLTYFHLQSSQASSRAAH